MTDPRLDEARLLYPEATEATFVRIAEAAEVYARAAEENGIEDGVAYSAGQTQYGCDWHWGTGLTLRDGDGAIIPDEDEEPTARVFDCDGTTLVLITEEWIRDQTDRTLREVFRPDDGARS